MTVRELIEQLLDFEMDTEVVIIANDRKNHQYDFFSINSVSGFNGTEFTDVELNFETGDFAFVNNDAYKTLLERVYELEDKTNG